MQPWQYWCPHRPCPLDEDAAPADTAETISRGLKISKQMPHLRRRSPPWLPPAPPPSVAGRLPSTRLRVRSATHPDGSEPVAGTPGGALEHAGTPAQ